MEYSWKQEPWPRWRPAEPWRGQSTELGTGRPCHVTRSEERDEKQRNCHWNVRFPEIEGGQPVPLTYWQEHRLNGLQLKVWHAHKAKDMGEGDNRTSWPRGLQHHEQKAVEAWRREWSKLQSILGKPRTKEIFPTAAPGMEMGLEEGIGMGIMEHEECRGRADNSPVAATLPPSLPHPCPSRPANGGTEKPPERVRKETAPTSWKPEGPEEGAHPPAPLWSAYNHEDIGRRGALPGRSANRKRGASRGTPEGQPAARHRAENRRCTKISRRNTTRRRSKSWQHP